MVPYKKTAKEVSFECSHQRISSTVPNVRPKLHLMSSQLTPGVSSARKGYQFPAERRP